VVNLIFFEGTNIFLILESVIYFIITNHTDIKGCKRYGKWRI